MPPSSAAPIAAGFDVTSDDIDDEIREIFLEEFSEESGNLHSFFDKWQAEPENVELIRPIRRVFHTLKGSGRLVGAMSLSDFSWKIESLLNRVLDGSRPASDSVVSMVGGCFLLASWASGIIAGAPLATH